MAAQHPGPQGLLVTWPPCLWPARTHPPSSQETGGPASDAHPAESDRREHRPLSVSVLPDQRCRRSSPRAARRPALRGDRTAEAGLFAGPDAVAEQHEVAKGPRVPPPRRLGPPRPSGSGHRLHSRLTHTRAPCASLVGKESLRRHKHFANGQSDPNLCGNRGRQGPPAPRAPQAELGPESSRAQFVSISNSRRSASAHTHS